MGNPYSMNIFFSMLPFHSEMTSLLRICEWQILAEFVSFFPVCLLLLFVQTGDGGLNQAAP